ncbi:MAG: Peptidase family S58 [Actinobacteria bacterium ADurb.Bin444]|nr:MAG: Peptidase family S58 [Actinobacteria bacterium ADurb.Bin444]
MTQELGIEGVRVGHYTDRAGGTGCTVILCPHGAMGAVEVRGQAPGTRETDILSPLSSVAEVHGVVLCGGSANGLAAASGVARYLEERGYGVRTPYGRVPLVSAAVIFDLPVGNPTARPSAEDAYAAAVAAGSTVEEGSVGAGTGATVGKLFREDSWMKGGIGLSKMSLPGGVIVAALSVVNAFGDVLAEDGSVLAGALLDGEFVNSHEYVLRLTEHPHFGRMEQTTLSVVITNARFRKIQCAAIARMAHDGMARAISPVHTPVDGDTVFVLSVGDRVSNVFQTGVAAADVVAASIRRGVRMAETLDGVKALRDLERPLDY